MSHSVKNIPSVSRVRQYNRRLISMSKAMRKVVSVAYILQHQEFAIRVRKCSTFRPQRIRERKRADSPREEHNRQLVLVTKAMRKVVSVTYVLQHQEFAIRARKCSTFRPQRSKQRKRAGSPREEHNRQLVLVTMTVAKSSAILTP
jgi:hypothetical protein